MCVLTLSIFYFSFSGKEVLMWSRHHRGPCLKQLSIADVVKCCALHPRGNLLITVTNKVELWDF